MDTMLSKALRDFMSGPLNQLIVNLAGEDGARVEEELNRFNRREPCWTQKKLLKFVRTAWLPAVDKFVAAEKFREGETVDDVRVAWLGENFKINFLGKVEEPVPALELREHELVKRAKDPAIITELGGEDQVETTLAHFWEQLKTAETKWHVRYIRDVNSVLWAVFGYWDSDGLCVEACPLGNPSDWVVGYRFASR